MSTIQTPSPGENGTLKPVLIVAGPTASGKSALALRLAEALDGVVINADSMQVYAELDILTARPSAEDIARVPHRLYGVIPAGESCSLVRWREMALGEIAAAHDAGKLPILCGGTGLYLKGLTEGVSDIPEIPDAVRAAARALHAEIGGAALRTRLAEEGDPRTAARLHDGDSQRLIRAWEVLQATGQGLSHWTRMPKDPPAGLRFLTILILPPREQVYARCDARLGQMLELGALDEVERLLDLDLDPELPAMKALGVPQFVAQLRGELSPETALETAQRETRRYAKRQSTWFRNQLLPNVTILEQFSESFASEIFVKIRHFLLTKRP